MKNRKMKKNCAKKMKMALKHVFVIITKHIMLMKITRHANGKVIYHVKKIIFLGAQKISRKQIRIHNLQLPKIYQ